MKILAVNPGHDGSVAYIVDGRLDFSIEAEKDSGHRYAAMTPDAVNAIIAGLDEPPDVVCSGGFTLNESHLAQLFTHVGYRGIGRGGIATGERSVAGRRVRYFSSSHERSHLLCAYGLSALPKGTPCYALVWEGEIGAFYEIDANLDITLIGNVMDAPGNRYAAAYGLADPSFPKDAGVARFTDAGKLMALASFSRRSHATAEEERLLAFLLDAPDMRLDRYEGLEQCPHYNVGTGDAEFRNFAGIVSDRIFDRFFRFAEAHLTKRLPLVIAGGCGLNCDWNSKWESCGLFDGVFVPPVANDSGSAIGTAIDAQVHFTGEPKVDWTVYAGLPFRHDAAFDAAAYDRVDADAGVIADLLAHGLILGWVNGRYEIGPRALGNRSIIAAPFEDATRERLNRIKQREQFRPIAPMCLEEDAARWFGCHHPSPHMLYTYLATTDALAAVTHVNRTARLQTVSHADNPAMAALLGAFRARTGYGVLCNTSLNFNGRGCINGMDDLDAYCRRHGLDGFVADGQAWLLRASAAYQAWGNGKRGE